MGLVAGYLATGLAIWVLGPSPFVFRSVASHLERRARTVSMARQRHYALSIGAIWSYVAVVAIIGELSGRTATSIGLSFRHLKPGAFTTSVVFIGSATVVIALVAGYTRFALWKNDESRRFIRNIALLPRNHRERFLYAATSISAGIGEEIVFRGFGIAYVEWLVPGASRPFVILVIAIAFGFAHYPHGQSTVLAATILGGLLTWVTLATGTLLPAIIVHTLVDLRMLALPSDLPDSSKGVVDPPKPVESA